MVFPRVKLHLDRHQAERKGTKGKHAAHRRAKVSLGSGSSDEGPNGGAQLAAKADRDLIRLASGSHLLDRTLGCGQHLACQASPPASASLWATGWVEERETGLEPAPACLPSRLARVRVPSLYWLSRSRLVASRRFYVMQKGMQRHPGIASKTGPRTSSIFLR